MDGQTNGKTDRKKDGRMDGQTDEAFFSVTSPRLKKFHEYHITEFLWHFTASYGLLQPFTALIGVIM